MQVRFRKVVNFTLISRKIQIFFKRHSFNQKYNPLKLKLVRHDFRQNTIGFISLVNEIFQTYYIEEIIESGTALGDGSTKILAQSDIPVKTIECNLMNYEKAILNLQSFGNVKVFHALSLNKMDILNFIENDRAFLENPGKDVYSDSIDPVGFYLKEVSQNVLEENILITFIENEKKQLIFLDSSGGIGYLEFINVMNLDPKYLKNKILLLDDIDHTKHIRSLRYLLDNKFRVVLSFDKRCCYCSFLD